ncbi:MAG TPA: substrate-binding domain-containing protein [Iamia sp.]|jgi:phosphate transport system substrate-binding protein|nr:substrate-binding domain-containing protein [Iamia sp.]
MRFRTRVLAAALAVTSVGPSAALVTSTPAQAADPTHVLTAAGSDTTEAVMQQVLARFSSSAANVNASGVANIPAVPVAPGFTVPTDNGCASRTYIVSGTPPTTYTAPNGSGAGRNALKDPTNLTNGCIDIARSSGGPSAGDPAGFRYFGFAKDAVSWAAFNGGRAPAALTKTQIKGIYDCSFTNWSEVGGTAGAIQRYLPQAGSGTRTFFIANILDGSDPTTVSSGSCPAVKLVEENKGNQVTAGDRPGAILPYSAGSWIAQANGATPNFRSTATVRAITVTGTALQPVAAPTFGKYKPNATVISGGAFPGVRTVYNVLHTDSLGYAEAQRAVGYDTANPASGVRSPLCNGQLATVLQTFGFTPLAANGNGITCTIG